ncbi:MAG: alcohol dehydrogenase catalytic domain-containing protein [Thaumarchaeota archaeon]|nr:alcohol dehydrogenase catalytic domain-containing protein [Nitrososphaerota archaeon]
MAGRFVKAAFVSAPGTVELKSVPRPDIEEGAVMVHMKACGICGSDLETVVGTNIQSSKLGHEVCGIVSESRDTTVREGDYVIPHNRVGCGICELCKSGNATTCPVFRQSNFEPCGFSEEFKLPAHNLKGGGIHFPSRGVSYEDASFVEPLGCCIRGLNQAVGSGGVKAANFKRVLVIGAGPIGLLHMELLNHYFPEIEIVACDIVPSRLEIAEKLEHARGIIPRGSLVSEAMKQSHSAGFDLVIVATGNLGVFSDAVQCVRKSGALLLFGLPHQGAFYNLDLASMFLNELKIIPSYSSTDVEMGAALQLLEQRKINVKKFITAVFPLSKVGEAFAAARSQNQMKVLVSN